MKGRRVAARAAVSAAVVGGVAVFILLSGGRTSNEPTPTTPVPTTAYVAAPPGKPVPLDPSPTVHDSTATTSSKSTGAEAGRARSTKPGVAQEAGRRVQSHSPGGVAPGSTGTLSPVQQGQPAVTWTVGGSCSHSGQTFTCHVTVAASNGLQSGGFVKVFPERGNGQDCVASGALVRDAVSLGNSCAFPLAANVLAVYVVSPYGNSPVLASEHLPWT
jgi:hypothetical protein